MYAGDTTLFSTDQDEIKKKLELAINWCKTNLLTITLKKKSTKKQWIAVGPQTRGMEDVRFLVENWNMRTSKNIWGFTSIQS